MASYPSKTQLMLDVGDEPLVVPPSPAHDPLASTPFRFAMSSAVADTVPLSRPNFADQQAAKDGMEEEEDISADSTPTYDPSKDPGAVRGRTPTTVLPPAAAAGSFAPTPAKAAAMNDDPSAIVSRLRHAMHIHMLPSDELRFIAEAMELKSYANGEEIVARAEKVANVYVILSGRVGVFSTPGHPMRRRDSTLQLGFAFEDNVFGAKQRSMIAGSSMPNPSVASPIWKRAASASAAGESFASGPPGETDPTKDEFSCIWWLQKGDLFGFDSVILREKSYYSFRAVGAAAVIGTIAREKFFHVVHNHVSVAQSLARKMCEDMGTFHVFKDYSRAVLSSNYMPRQTGDEQLGASAKMLDMGVVIRKFSRINNGIYAGLHSPRLDCGAWNYGLKRLPSNITECLNIELIKAPEPHLVSLMRKLAGESDLNPHAKVAAERFHVVPNVVRRRFSFQTGSAKTITLMRDSTTDLLDFISCLCVHVIESRKLRRRLLHSADPSVVSDLEDALVTAKSKDAVMLALTKLPLDEGEQKGLFGLWGVDTLRRVYDIATQHDDDLCVRVDFHSSRRFYRNPSLEWAQQIRLAMLNHLKLAQDDDLPNDLVIEIFSSNAHSVKNCLGSFGRTHKEKILKWGREMHTDLTSLDWFNEDDLVYYLSSKYLERHPEAKQEWMQGLASQGVLVLQDTCMTGLEAEVIDVSMLNPALVDPFLAPAVRAAVNALPKCSPPPPGAPHSDPTCPIGAPRRKRHFIINIDFPFAAQSEAIAKSLILSFGRRIRSVNVMGKSGGLCGNRGDVQIARHILFSKSALPFDDWVDELRSVGDDDLTPATMEQLMGGTRKAYEGTVVTIAGTQMQSRKLLRYYLNLWRCVGIEMEGSYFARAVKEHVEQGVLREDVKTRFLYYTSDLPLATSEETLASGMKPNEGVPPTYAITRAILNALLQPLRKVTKS